jgi:hypothetical protein
MEDRTLLSAANTAQMAEQLAPMMAMVQQELNNAVQIITQEIAQVEAIFVEEVDHLLGVPTTQNPTPGSDAGNSSGSASGTTCPSAQPRGNFLPHRVVDCWVAGSSASVRLR